MKLDLILENIRNQYTLGLIEESTIEGLDERTVLKGKMLINESTMELRKMLIQEGVMADVRALLHDGFARVIEESEFDWEPAEPDYNADAQARADLQSQLDAKNAAYADLDAKYIKPAIAAGQNFVQPGIDAAGEAYGQARAAVQPAVDAYNRATPYEVASIPAAAAIGYGAYKLGQRHGR